MFPKEINGRGHRKDVPEASELFFGDVDKTFVGGVEVDTGLGEEVRAVEKADDESIDELRGPDTPRVGINGDTRAERSLLGTSAMDHGVLS